MIHAIISRCPYCGNITPIFVSDDKERLVIHNIPRTNVECDESEMIADTHNNRTNGYYVREVQR